MEFSTYPVNPLNPGSLIPIILGKTWSENTNSKLSVYIDTYAIPKKVENFDIREYNYSSFENVDFLTHDKHFDIASINAQVYEYEGVWKVCNCGKVEIFDIETLVGFRSKMIVNGRCILCSSPIKEKNNRGLIARFDKQNTSSYLQHIFPVSVVPEIDNWVQRLINKPFLLSRIRETNYQSNYKGNKYFIDPTIFNIAKTWNDNKGEWIISGRDGLLTYALGKLLFCKNANHIFLPKIKIDSWSKFISTGEDILRLILITSLNWKKNMVKIDFSTMAFIVKNLEKITLMMKGIEIREPNDILRFNSNLLNFER
jgi:hypothetical protein